MKEDIKPLTSFKQGWQAAKPLAKKIAKKAIPGIAVYGAGKALKEKRWGDAVGEAAWATVPTGLAYEAGTALASDKRAVKTAKALKSGMGIYGK